MKGIPALDEGLALYNAGRFEAAVERFRRVLRDPRPTPEAYCFLAHALESSGRSKEAEKCFATAVRRFPGFMRAYLDWASLKRRLGRPYEEKAVLARALARAPRDLAVRSRLEAARKAVAALYSEWRAGGDAPDRLREKLDALRREAEAPRPAAWRRSVPATGAYSSATRPPRTGSGSSIPLWPAGSVRDCAGAGRARRGA